MGTSGWHLWNETGAGKIESCVFAIILMGKTFSIDCNEIVRSGCYTELTK